MDKRQGVSGHRTVTLPGSLSFYKKRSLILLLNDAYQMLIGWFKLLVF